MSAIVALPAPAPAPVSGLRWHLPEVTGDRVRRALARAFAADARGLTASCTKLFVDGGPVDPAGARSVGKPGAGAGAGAGHDLFAWGRAAQTHDRTLFRALVTGLEPWFAAHGLPQGRVEAEVFCGRYRATPGGIHRETCSNLHLVVEGEKTMEFWTGDAWPPGRAVLREDRDPGSGAREQYLPGLDPREHRESARSLTAGPGQGFAWPAGTWHVGRSEGGPSLALNVAAYGRGPGWQGPVLRAWAGRFAGEVPGDWLEDYRRHLAWHEGAGDLLATLSGLGMRPPEPSPVPRPLPRAVRLAAPVLWHRGRHGLRVAALGASVLVPDRAEIREWLSEGLRSGRCPDVPPVCRAVAGWLAGRGATAVRGES